jgi:hypothetical protein
VLYPLSLLLSPTKGFYIDWYNHLWLIGYYGKHFAVHHVMPLALNTDSRLLEAFPTFYGFLFYPVAGLVSSVTGPLMAVRLAVVLLWVGRFWLVYRLAFQISGHRLISMALACLVSWEIYPLTNLYNRSALTELFATTLLTCAVCAFPLMMMAASSLERMFFLLVTGVALSLTLASHPITALYAVPFCGALLLAGMTATLVGRRTAIGRPVLYGTLLALFVFLTVLPWLYATVGFAKDLMVSVSPTLILFPNDIDHVATRFAPFPYDFRSDLRSPNDVSTPFLDAQVDVALLLLVAALAILGLVGRRDRDAQGTNQEDLLERVLFGTSLVMFLCATVLSVSDWAYQYLPASFKLVQFPYRLITYQNLMLLVAALSAIAPSRTRFCATRTGLVVTTLCLTIAGVGVSVKLSHGLAITETAFAWRPATQSFDDDEALLIRPRTFYGYNDYTFRESPSLPREFRNVVLTVDRGKSFGKVRPATEHFLEAGWIQTNVAASPWNVVLVDGVQVPPDDLRVRGYKLMVRVSPGTHVIDARFIPDPAYVWLRRVSFGAFAIWTGATILLAMLLTLKTALAR